MKPSVPANVARSAALLIAVASLSGCVVVVFPHTTRISPEIEGRVVDSRTRMPVDQALVQMVDRPKVAALSRADGSFVLPHARNWHALWWGTYDGIDVHLPEGKAPSSKLRISRLNYITSEFGIQEKKVIPESYRWPWDPQLLNGTYEPKPVRRVDIAK